MKKLRKLTRKQKDILTKNGLDYNKYLLERQDPKSYTFVHRETKETVKLNFYM
ncbi:DUF6906 family protein [Romboutsia maritimum]|uniref:DUF6906 family protein n=1 Tax=Romboutsia maritimum TaxID=2020948 RepID=UPI001313E817|nr:hypothetical protein [Romboutsia maritimum]